MLAMFLFGKNGLGIAGPNLVPGWCEAHRWVLPDDAADDSGNLRGS